MSFVYFLIWFLFFLLLSFQSSLYILDIVPFLDMQFAKIILLVGSLSLYYLFFVCVFVFS